jgi:hypothetical protein
MGKQTEKCEGKAVHSGLSDKTLGWLIRAGKYAVTPPAALQRGYC